MGKQTTLEERMLICELAAAGYSDRQIAEQLGWALSTVRKWRRRGRAGRAGLASQRGRPARGALSTFDPTIRETLQQWRTAHPGWGPTTLRAELKRDGRFAHLRLPSARRIADFLKEAGLTRAYERHRELPQSKAVTTAPHQLWEMDARGHERVAEVGIVALINLNDRCSRLRLLSYPCLVGQHRLTRSPATPDYQLVLRLAFSEWGLPDSLQVDHDSVFYDNTTKSPFPTRFHLWLLALGVSLTFGRVGRATDQGLTEQSHQLWAQQVLEGQQFASWEALYQALQQRRHFLNAHLPCTSLGDVPPLTAYPEATRPRRLYRPEWESDLLDLTRVDAYLAQGQWFRQVSAVGTLSLGGQIYSLGTRWKEQQVELTFDPATRHFLVCSADGTQRERLPVTGLTPETLMGDLTRLVDLPAFQLALPFSWDEWRILHLSDAMGDTT